MALKERYYTIDGQIVGYKKSGARKDFLTDALGSVTAEVDQTGNTKTFDGRYQPYGGILSSAGSKGSFGWVGTWGYRETGLGGSSHYVRARHYSKTGGNWNTADKLWPIERPYLYVDNRQVTQYIDLTGMAPGTSICGESHDCSLDPRGTCIWAQWKGLDYPNYPKNKSPKSLAGVICCAGILVPCVWANNRPKGSYPPGLSFDPRNPRKEIVECLTEHEIQHFPPLPCTEDGRPSPVYGKKPPYTGNFADECNAYQVEMRCYERKGRETCLKISNPKDRKSCIDEFVFFGAEACREIKKKYPVVLPHTVSN